MNWSLSQLLGSLHDDIQNRLERVRKSLGHSPSKGDACETVWIELFNTYLPSRYKAAKAFVVDSHGNFSHQIDVVVYDRQYSPLIFRCESQIVIAAESVYAIFEAKQTIAKAQIRYASEKAASVRRLHRTSLPIPYAGGTYDPKPLHPILAGVLTFESDWNPPLGRSLVTALQNVEDEARLDMGCIAAHGYFWTDQESRAYTVDDSGKHATGFLLKLISTLQGCATVPMIDVQAYAAWLAE